MYVCMSRWQWFKNNFISHMSNICLCFFIRVIHFCGQCLLHIPYRTCMYISFSGQGLAFNIYIYILHFTIIFLVTLIPLYLLYLKCVKKNAFSFKIRWFLFCSVQGSLWTPVPFLFVWPRWCIFIPFQRVTTSRMTNKNILSKHVM